MLIFNLFLILFTPLFSEKLTNNFHFPSKQIKFANFPHSYNPSMIKVDDEILFIFRHNPNPSKQWLSETVIVRLDKDFNPISNPQVLSFRSTEFNPSYAYDCRLFTLNNRIFIVFSDVADWNIPHKHERPVFFFTKETVYISELKLINGRFITSHPLRLIYKNKNEQIREKNWMPFEWNGSLFLTYYPVPHEIIRSNMNDGLCELFSITYPKTQWNWGEIRGGTPPIKIDNAYLSFFHSSKHMQSNVSPQKKFHYFMGAYTFLPDPPFTITRISPNPIISEGMYTYTEYPHQVIFPCGCIDHNDFLYVSYGKNDSEMWIAKIPKQELLNSLIPVAQNDD